MKKGPQQRRNTPIITPTVMVAYGPNMRNKIDKPPHLVFLYETVTDLLLVRRLPHHGAPVVGLQRAVLDRRGGLALLPAARPDLRAIAALHRPAALYLGQQPAPAHPLVHTAGQLGRRLDTLHVAAPYGPQLEVDGEHDEAGQ